MPQPQQPQPASPPPAAVRDPRIEAQFNEIRRRVLGLQGQVVNVSNYGAIGDGVADDTAAIQAALDAAPTYSSVFFPGSIYLISSTLTIPSDNLFLYGPSKLLAKAATSFEYILLGTARTGVVVQRLDFDANKANRTSGQSTRLMGAGFSASTDCSFVYCTARNTRGYNGTSAVGLVLSGGTRCHAFFPTLLGCGDAGNSPTTDSDGVYCSSDDSFIACPDGYQVTDTVAVVESANRSHIFSVIAKECCSAAALSNASSSAKVGCSIRGVISTDWTKANTGHVLVAALGTGDFTDWIVDGVETSAAGTAGHGEGPIIAVTEASSGLIKRGKIINSRLRGSTTQGVLVDATEVKISETDVDLTGAAAIQFQKGTHLVQNSLLTNGTYGIYANGTSVVTSKNNVVTGAATAQYGKAGGATINNFRGDTSVSADRGDNSVTVVAGVDAPLQRFATALTANRTVTLSTVGATNGDWFRVVRTGLGVFTLDVGGLKTVVAATAAFVDVAFDGTAWRLTAYGVL